MFHNYWCKASDEKWYTGYESWIKTVTDVPSGLSLTPSQEEEEEKTN
jgi:hypothetical protein